MITILWSIFYLLFPLLILFLCIKFPAANKIGAVLLCYLGGILIGNIGILPKEFTGMLGFISEASVAISLPLLLFSMNVKKWFSIAGKALLSMLGAIIAAVAVASALFIFFKGSYPDSWMLAGMSIGVYTGGTPNLAAIKAALGISGNTYILFHTYDTIISLIYIMFLISVAQKFFGKFLPAFDAETRIPKSLGADVHKIEEEEESITAYGGIFKKKILTGLAIALLLSVAVVGLSLFLSGFFPEDFSAAFTIILITTFSILLSFVPKVRNIRKTFQFGMYVIYIFCFVVASMTDLKQLITIDFTILTYVGVSIVGSLLLHALFCRIFRIDTDTFLITSVSAICSPPFVPVVAAALKNKDVLLSGLTTGIIGYAAGNYLGISIALFLKNFI
ncbi:MAG: DUF819 family protein [Spirochaetales bacterium]|nr:DUF819 family protein [Spirochaetales bacterium]